MSATYQVLVLNNYNIENEKQFGMKRNNLIHEELSACCIHVTVFLNTHFVICIIIIVGMSLKSNYNRANDVCGRVCGWPCVRVCGNRLLWVILKLRDRFRLSKYTIKMFGDHQYFYLTLL